MTEKSTGPGFLAVGPKVKKTDRRVLAAILAVITGLVLVLMGGLTAQKETGSGQVGASPQVETENKPLTPPVEGFGLALPALTDTPQPSEPEALTFVGPPQVDPDLEAARREADEIRRRKFERTQQAYGSALLVKREHGYAGPGADSVDKDGDGHIDPHAPPYTGQGPDGYDPAADRDKEAFFTRTESREWRSPYTREAGRRYEVKTGTVIPGLMISGINSDLPGSLIAQVTQNVSMTRPAADIFSCPRGPSSTASMTPEWSMGRNGFS